MLKFLVGLAVGVLGRDVLIEVYNRQSFPYQRRLENVYYVARYGCEAPMSHNHGCPCEKKESR